MFNTKSLILTKILIITYMLTKENTLSINNYIQQL